jgi:drug/metabolite transporter (DMT)-like permease
LVSAAASQSRIVAAVIWMVCAALATAWMNVALRWVSLDLHPFEATLFRLGLGAAILLPFFVRSRPALDRRLRLLLLARGCLLAVSAVTWYVGIQRTALAVATGLDFCVPLLVTAGAVLFLGETPPRRLHVALVLGVVGVSLIATPLAGFEPGAGFIVLSSICVSGFLLLGKVAVRDVPALSLTFYSFLVAAGACLLMAIPFWTWPSTTDLAVLAVAAAGGALSHVAVAKALALVDATLVGVLDLMRLPAAMGVGFVLFAEALGVAATLGIACVLASAVIVIVGGVRAPNAVTTARMGQAEDPGASARGTQPEVRADGVGERGHSRGSAEVR